MITVVNYGAGNLRSVLNTLGEIGASYEVTAEASDVETADKIILPGVGHFGHMMHALDSLGLRKALVAKARSRKPFLGICVGLQALFDSSAEAPNVKGLGLFPGIVQRFPLDARCPHMGWNQLQTVRPSRLLKGLDADPYVYFAHSYYCPLSDATAATTHYTRDYTALLEYSNLFGVQFHPEKSGPVGLQIVRNFVEL